MTKKGQCLCGAVKFSAQPKNSNFGVCHCGMCRRWTAGPFMGLQCGNSIVFENENAVGVFRSSNWGERVFCKECGTPLMWRTHDKAMTSVSIMAFDDLDDISFTSQIFIDSKPAHYEFSNKTHDMTEAEVMAMFAP